MSFASTAFVYFLAATFVLFYSVPDRWRNTVLLAASYFFYGYWSWRYLLLLIFTMVLDYAIALGIAASADLRRRRLLLSLSIVLNLGVLFLFKYFDMFAGALAALSGGRDTSLHLILPFGISFYTFHAMSYTIDVYRGVVPAERNFTYYSGYVMFFPQLVAGPIARASHLLHQFSEQKRLRFENVTDAAWLIAKGYVLKVVLADNLAPAVDAFLGTELARTPFREFQAVYFFAFQIYFDFLGYTNIARGVARLFDFDLVVNFDRPYAAAGIRDFWRRWHISLSTWLRDYLYISLGGSRKGRWRTYGNLLLTMLLGGLWHGANITFAVWGLLHGLYLAVERAAEDTVIARAYGRPPRAVRVFATFNLVCLSWIFFRSATLGEAWRWIGDVLAFFRHPLATTRVEINVVLWLGIAAWMLFEAIEDRLDLPTRYAQAHWSVQFATVYAAFAVVLLFGQVNPKAFIYFQF